MSFNNTDNASLASDNNASTSNPSNDPTTTTNSTNSPPPPNNALSTNTNNSNEKTTLWMGELDPWLDESAIHKIWAAYGENVTVKIIRDKYSGANAGYCFVDFGSSAAANKALSLNGQPMPNSGRNFKLNWASGGGINDRKEDRGPEWSIFVGDLAPDVSEAELFQVFQSNYPSCKSAKIMTDPMTNISRGYGFVRFGEEIHMQRALAEMQGYYCGNRPMRISTATPKNKNAASAAAAAAMMNAAAAAGSQGHPHNPHHNPHHHHAHAPPQWQMGHPAAAPVGFYGTPQPINQFTDPNNTTVFVGGLSSSVSEEELRRYFQPFGDIVYVKIPPGKGCGFVQYIQRHSAETAITQMQGFPIGNSRVRLSWGRSQNAMNNGVGNSGQYRPAAAPPPVYAQMGIPAQPHYGPFGPLNPQAAHVHDTQHLNPNAPLPPVNAPPIPVAQNGMPSQTSPDAPVAPGQDPSEPVPVARLNELYLAARDGRLDRVESDNRGYHGVYAQ